MYELLSTQLCVYKITIFYYMWLFINHHPMTSIMAFHSEINHYMVGEHTITYYKGYVNFLWTVFYTSVKN